MQTEIVFIILGMAVITFLTRSLLIIFFREGKDLRKMMALTRFVPIPVLTSLITPALLAPRGHLDLSLGNEYLVAGVVATAVAVKTKSLVLVIVIGIATILLMRLFI